MIFDISCCTSHRLPWPPYILNPASGRLEWGLTTARAYPFQSVDDGSKPALSSPGWHVPSPVDRPLTEFTVRHPRTKGSFSHPAQGCIPRAEEFARGYMSAGHGQWESFLFFHTVVNDRGSNSLSSSSEI